MDAKQFPLRGIEEPDTSKVLRGSHDGFVESIMKNPPCCAAASGTPG